MRARPFTIHVEQQVLDDLRIRLLRTRWSTVTPKADWRFGTSPEYLRELVAYWQSGYDWRREEAKLNELPQFKADIGATDLHFVHVARDARPFPLLLLHGWPDSFHRFTKIVPMLTGTARTGPNRMFDVVVPSLPGFGFSGGTERGREERPLRKAADVLFQLMTEVLGYRRFGIAGSDTGGALAQILAIDHPETVVGIHLTDLGWHASSIDPSSATRAEKKYLDAAQKRFMTDGAYVAVQTTRPRSLSPALADSPMGLASWIVDRFFAWSDAGDHLNAFSKDDLLTNVMLYWVTNSIGSSVFTYYAEARSPSLRPSDRVKVPVAVALFPNDIGGIPPRSLAERTLDVRRWTEMPRGGHFAALEQPESYARDVSDFFDEVGTVRSNE